MDETTPNTTPITPNQPINPLMQPPLPHTDSMSSSPSYGSDHSAMNPMGSSPMRTFDSQPPVANFSSTNFSQPNFGGTTGYVPPTIGAKKSGFPVLALFPILAILGLAIAFAYPIFTKEQTFQERLDSLLGKQTVPSDTNMGDPVPFVPITRTETTNPITPDPTPIAQVDTTIPVTIQPAPTAQLPLSPKTGIAPENASTPL